MDKNSSLSRKEQLLHPEWVGKHREMVQMIQETQEQGIEVFI